MDDLTVKYILEALLMSSHAPLSKEKLLSAFEDHNKPTMEQLKQSLDRLAMDYQERSIELTCLASGYCFQTKSQYSAWITRLLFEKQAKYSGAFLEVLAIIAYKQPVTRADIEAVRGVSVSPSMIKTLIEREWIEVTGYKDAPGKPVLYKTTTAFLNYFNLRSLNDLPQGVINNEQ